MMLATAIIDMETCRAQETACSATILHGEPGNYRVPSMGREAPWDSYQEPANRASWRNRTLNL